MEDVAIEKFKPAVTGPESEGKLQNCYKHKTIK